MHHRLAEIADDLARRRAAVLAAVASVPAEDLERRATPDGWSVAQVLDHLRVVEAGTARLLARRIARARESGVGPPTGDESVLGCMDAHEIEIVRERRVAPEMVAPGQAVTAREALEGLADSRQALLDALRDADDLDLTRVSATHAVFGELDGYQWFVWLGQHETRHVGQIEAIGAALAAQAAPGDG